jgi:hypothetical protein
MIEKEHSSQKSPLGNSNPRVYEKPLFEKIREMTFPVDVINSLGHSIRCNQCSACHGCAGT